MKLLFETGETEEWLKPPQKWWHLYRKGRKEMNELTYF